MPVTSLTVEMRPGAEVVPTSMGTPFSGSGKAGAVARLTDSGTFCVYSPLIKGQVGACLSCSDLEIKIPFCQ